MLDIDVFLSCFDEYLDPELDFPKLLIVGDRFLLNDLGTKALPERVAVQKAHLEILVLR